ncbi:MAG: hypothetical protein ACRC2T_05130 [Thermoguttaceae bacterium]
MTSLTIYVGIDYRQKEIQLCLMNQDGKILTNISLPNNPSTVDIVARKHKPNKIVAGIEACNGALNFLKKLRELGWYIDQGHPGSVARCTAVCFAL